jgi:hypothetical protein
MQATGRVTIKLDSEQLRSKPGASIQIGGIQRDFDVTDQLESYFKEKGSVAVIKCTIVHASDTDIIKLRDFLNGTAFFTTDTNHCYTIANAALATMGDLANGEVEVTIMGDPAQQ